jgi:hypothetical protein
VIDADDEREHRSTLPAATVGLPDGTATDVPRLWGLRAHSLPDFQH